MTGFRSNEEFFQAVRDLIATLEAGGHPQAAATLRDGFGCLNGLTDGWALFLQSIENVQATESKRFSPGHQKALEAIRAAAHAAVYRR
ncbi:MAG: hypothetical protein A2Y78_00495 [Acidobacteria bacterium RBG_13_68_16]|jgi:hypothetical protein|nr:MAG: hypothetical protein A2Y78_00495 [Acidobacteria bacterium RBG_13_68_16]